MLLIRTRWGAEHLLEMVLKNSLESRTGLEYFQKGFVKNHLRVSPLSLSLEANSSVAVYWEKRNWAECVMARGLLSPACAVSCAAVSPLPRAQRGGLVHGLHDPEYPVYAHRQPRQRHRRGADGQQAQRQRLLQDGREQLQDVCCLLCFSLTLCQRKSWRFYYLVLNFINLESVPPHFLYKPKRVIPGYAYLRK